MTYSEAYDILVRYCNRAVPYFADKFSRWPVGTPAGIVAAFARESAVSYDDISSEGDEIARKLRAVADIVFEKGCVP